jgi:hypothetical protein
LDLLLLNNHYSTKPLCIILKILGFEFWLNLTLQNRLIILTIIRLEDEITANMRLLDWARFQFCICNFFISARSLCNSAPLLSNILLFKPNQGKKKTLSHFLPNKQTKINHYFSPCRNLNEILNSISHNYMNQNAISI